MNLDGKIESYILNHIDKEDDILNELYRETCLKVLNPRMISGHLQGKILEFISKMINPNQILEIGTYTGYSAICLAKGLQLNGRLHTIEINDELNVYAKKYINKAGLADKIILYIGDALRIIPEINEKFDLVFIDGDKKHYIQYYNLVIEKVNKGGFIIADNVLWSGKVINPKEKDEYTTGIKEFNKLINDDDRVENVIFPIRDGISLIRKKRC